MRVAFQKTGKIADWARLVRLPNLASVPGDPIAGFFLAGAVLAPRGAAPSLAGLTLVSLAALALYAAGMIQNDLADLDSDKRLRPERPLPSGRVKAGTARRAVLVMSLSAVALALMGSFAAGLVAVLLLAMICFYNLAAKLSNGGGPLAMGACRGLSLLMGAAVWGWGGLAIPLVLAAAVGHVAFIAAITRLAAVETSRIRTARRAYEPFAAVSFAISLVLLIFLATLVGRGYPISRSALVLALVTAALTIFRGWKLFRANRETDSPAANRRRVGQWIRLLIFLQAFLIMLGGAPAFALGLLVLAPTLGAILARKFPAS